MSARPPLAVLVAGGTSCVGDRTPTLGGRHVGLQAKCDAVDLAAFAPPAAAASKRSKSER